MALSMRWRDATPLEVRLNGLCPDRLATLTPPAIAALPALIGNATAHFGDLFQVDGDASDGVVRLEGNLSHVLELGKGMASGRLEIMGNVGSYLGAEMSGGLIEVRGDVADWAGVELRGGRITIHGNCGDWMGAAYPGERLGMRAGEILVHGNVGANAGVALRRGLIAISGSVGDGAGRGMVAGSLFVNQKLGPGAGLGMKRGTIAWLASQGDVESHLLPTFLPAGLGQYPFVGIYLKHLEQRGFPVPEQARIRTFARYNGDVAQGGRGEILVAAS